MTYVLWLDDADARSADLVGGKFSSLAEMSGAGFAVPAAFAVTTAAFRELLRESGLEEQARAATDVSDGKAMQAAIEASPLPPAVADAIAAAYARLGDDVPVAVRSSGVAEDLAGASFAGQYETYLWILGGDAVLEHVRRCWTGLFGEAVLSYRPGGASGDRGMAVVVQQMVAARAAGVTFTLDPVTGDRSKIVIEGAWGLGEAVVSGEVTPDRFRVDKVTLEPVDRTISEKVSEYRFESGAVALRDVPDDRRSLACLEDAQVAELAALAKRIEAHRGAPQDIEWAVDEGGAVHVLQVRPETVWSTRGARTVSVGGKSAVDLVLGTFVGGGRLKGSDDA
jgi:pyruvate,water dikinase